MKIAFRFLTSNIAAKFNQFCEFKKFLLMLTQCYYATVWVSLLQLSHHPVYFIFSQDPVRWIFQKISQDACSWPYFWWKIKGWYLVINSLLEMPITSSLTVSKWITPNVVILYLFYSFLFLRRNQNCFTCTTATSLMVKRNLALPGENSRPSAGYWPTSTRSVCDVDTNIARFMKVWLISTCRRNWVPLETSMLPLTNICRTPKSNKFLLADKTPSK